MGQSIHSDYGVSVVIPVYNYERYVAEAVASALDQTCPPEEVIVVDDGSTDRTGEVVRQFGDRVRYFRQENAGLSAARNRGIALATQPIVGFLDADDRWTNRMVERCVEALRTLPQEFALIATCRRLIGPDGVPFGPEGPRYEGGREFTAGDLALRSRFTPAVMVRKCLFEKCGLFDEGLTASEDRDMWIRIALRARVWMLGERLVDVRRHGSNMSRNTERQSANMRVVLRKARLAGVQEGAFYWRRVWGVYHYENSMMYHRSHRLGRAMMHMAASFACWPWYFAPAKIDEGKLFRLRRLGAFVAEQFRDAWGLGGWRRVSSGASEGTPRAS